MVITGSAIRVKNLKMEFQEHVREGFLGLINTKNHLAIKDISLDVETGERLAVIGRNGSGKSTLLRCIAGFHKPKSGIIETNGRVILLAGTDPGFNKQLTGRQNVLDMAGAYGIPNAEKVGFVEGVRKFAELGENFDRKYGNYSSGMKGKLGFGFVSSITTDLLLIDETFGSGDLEFKEKAKLRMKELLEDAGTVVMCTHSLSLASEICDRVIVLENGFIVFDGEMEEGLDFYKSLNRQIVEWVEFPYSERKIEDGSISFDFLDEFGLNEDIRLVVYDSRLKDFIFIEVIPAGSSIKLSQATLSGDSEYKFKIQQKRLGRWYDASKYVNIIRE